MINTINKQKAAHQDSKGPLPRPHFDSMISIKPTLSSRIAAASLCGV